MTQLADLDEDQVMAGASQRDRVGMLSPSLLEEPGEPRRQVVGVSKDFDFGEAMRDAVDQIPTSDIPDWLAPYHVVSIDAKIGGIAGFNQLEVTVRGG